MKYIFKKESIEIPEGFRSLTDEEIAKDFKALDMDKSYLISKNEWMLSFIKLLGEDIEALNKEGLDSIMDKIQDLSNEFDKYDLDHNKYIDFDEYKNFITQNLFISE